MDDNRDHFPGLFVDYGQGRQRVLIATCGVDCMAQVERHLRNHEPERETSKQIGRASGFGWCLHCAWCASHIGGTADAKSCKLHAPADCPEKQVESTVVVATVLAYLAAMWPGRPDVPDHVASEFISAAEHALGTLARQDPGDVARVLFEHHVRGMERPEPPQDDYDDDLPRGWERIDGHAQPDLWYEDPDGSAEDPF